MGRDVVELSLPVAAPRLRATLHSSADDPTAAWRRVIHTCAQDVGQPLQLRTRRADRTGAALILHLPAALAAAQHPVWCLACRLACFLPQIRVSVLVVGEKSFIRPDRATRRRLEISRELAS